MSTFINTSNENSQSGINFIGFNQDAGCFAVGLKNGFRVYNTDPLKENERMNFINQMQSGVGHVEMLFRTNFLGILGGGSNSMFPANQCRIWDDIKRKFVIEFEYPTDIKSVKLRYDRMILVLELCVKVYSFEALPKLLFQVDSGPNVLGLCALTTGSSGPALMAVVDKKPGRVDIYDLSRYENESAQPLNSFTAHQNSLSAMLFNPLGSILATSSSKGTLIRLFNPLNGQKMHELRRGTNNAVIYSISFSQDSSLLSVTSDHDTVHVFRLDGLVAQQSNNTFNNGDINSGESITTAGGIASAPTHKTSSGRNTSDIRCVLNSKAKAVAAFSITSPHTLIVLDANGSYLKYSFSDKIGCTAKREQCVNFLNYDDDDRDNL